MAAAIAAVVGGVVWFGFGIGVLQYGTVDDCGNTISSLAPLGIWITMLVGGGTMASGTTVWTVLRRANAVASPHSGAISGLALNVCLWIAVGTSAIWFAALHVVGLPSNCDYGRPLRRADGSADLPTVRHDARSARTREHRALTRHWLRIARGEFASIAAFVELERSLVAHDAPPRLTDACRRAQHQELRHAELASDLVERFSGARPGFEHRVVEPPPADLVRLAVESWFDGCLNEGAAAAEAAVRSAHVADVQINGALGVIADDELEHAELAWAIIEWAMETGGAPVRTALHAALGAPADARRGIERPWWLSERRAAAVGWIDPRLCAGLHPELLADARRRLGALLVGNPRPSYTTDGGSSIPALSRR